VSTKLRQEVEALRAELDTVRQSRESSIAEQEVKRERERWWDPFGANGGSEGALFGDEVGSGF